MILIWVSCMLMASNALAHNEKYKQYFADSSHKDSLVLTLRRQQTPRQQMMNAPDYGVSFDYLYKKHHSNTPRTNDSVALYRYLDNEFYAEVIFGHPGQKMNVAFDTTSEVTWVISSKCSSLVKPWCVVHNKYDNKKSSTYIPDGRPYSQNDGAYNITGFYSIDNIRSIGHSNVTNQSFAEIDDIEPSFVVSKADGVFGFAIQASSAYSPIFYTLRQQNKIKDPIFSIYLNRDRQSNHGGNVMLGFIEERHIHKDPVTKKYDQIMTFPVDPHYSYWQFKVDLIMLETHPSTVLCPDGCQALPSSSSNVIIGPSKDIKILNEAIEAREFVFGYHVVNCDTVNKLPPLHFVLGGKNFTLASRDYIMKMTYRSVQICASVFQEASAAFEEDRWFLGGAFLAEYYSIYNTDTNEIGFVKAAP